MENSALPLAFKMKAIISYFLKAPHQVLLWSVACPHDTNHSREQRARGTL